MDMIVRHIKSLLKFTYQMKNNCSPSVSLFQKESQPRISNRVTSAYPRLGVILSAIQNMNIPSFQNATCVCKDEWMTVVLLTLNLLFRPVFTFI